MVKLGMALPCLAGSTQISENQPSSNKKPLVSWDQVTEIMVVLILVTVHYKTLTLRLYWYKNNHVYDRINLQLWIQCGVWRALSMKFITQGSISNNWQYANRVSQNVAYCQVLLSTKTVAAALLANIHHIKGTCIMHLSCIDQSMNIFVQSSSLHYLRPTI